MFKANQEELTAVKGVAEERAEIIKNELRRLKEGTTEAEELNKGGIYDKP